MSGAFNAKGNIVNIPRHCGLRCDEVSDDALRALTASLTEEEQASPFASYFSYELAQPSEDMIRAFADKPMAPGLAFMPEEAGKRFLRPGYDEGEMGYCILPNGIGYAAMLIDIPGRTDEMQNAFNEEFGLGDGNLAYKVWFPGAHYMHFVDGCYEDMGFGPRKIKFLPPVEFSTLGIDGDKILEADPTVLHLRTIPGIAYNPFDPEKKHEHSCILTELRSTPRGRELRLRYWFGVKVTDGRLVPCLAPGESCPIEFVRETAKHFAYEYCNSNKLVNAYWAARNK